MAALDLTQEATFWCVFSQWSKLNRGTWYEFWHASQEPYPREVLSEAGHLWKQWRKVALHVLSPSVHGKRSEWFSRVLSTHHPIWSKYSFGTYVAPSTIESNHLTIFTIFSFTTPLETEKYYIPVLHTGNLSTESNLLKVPQEVCGTEPSCPRSESSALLPGPFFFNSSHCSSTPLKIRPKMSHVGKSVTEAPKISGHPENVTVYV